MSVLGGLSIDCGRWDFLFVSLKKNKFIPYTGISGESGRSFGHLREFIMNNIDYIDERLSYIEEKNYFKAKNVFFRLPREYASKKKTENVISLNVAGRAKRITWKDIDYVKRQIENISLNLEDVCIHHLVLEYRIEDKTFSRPPVGMWARKIYVKSLIVFVSSYLYDTFTGCFDNIERKFSGFVYGALADYSAAYSGIADKLVFVVNIKENETVLSCFRGRSIISEKVYSFSNNSIVSYVAERLSFDNQLVSELIFKYGSFKNSEFSKEISVREKGAYINVSLTALNNLIIEAVTEGIGIIVSDIKKGFLPDDYTMLFIGKIAQKENFYNFVQAHFDVNVERPSYGEFSPSAFGCVRYGATRLFEREKCSDSLWHRAIKFYKDYF